MGMGVIKHADLLYDVVVCSTRRTIMFTTQTLFGFISTKNNLEVIVAVHTYHHKHGYLNCKRYQHIMTISDMCLKTGHDTLQENQHCCLVNIYVVIPTLPSDLNATTNLLRKFRIHNTDWDSLR